MIRYKVFWSAVITAAVLTGTALAGEKVFVYASTTEPKTIDPVLNSAVDGSQIDYNIFEGLLRIGRDDRPEPGQAESWEISEDYLTWTFHLRPNLKWSDGQPITAEQFRYGFLRVIDPKTASPNAYLGFSIKNGEKYYNGEASADEVGIKALDDRTLQIELEYVNPLEKDHLTYHSFVPARSDIVEANPRTWMNFPETAVSNGAFYLTEWRHNSELTLSKNPYYWDADNIKIDKVRFVVIADANTTLASFKSGKIDFFKNPPQQLKNQLIAKGEAQVVNTMGDCFGVFNVNAAPFDDVRVRRAFSLAIDRDIIANKVILGGVTPALSYIPDQVPGPSWATDFRSGGKNYFEPKAQVEEARKLLAEAGYPDGKGFPKVSYKYNHNDINKALAEALQGMWKNNLGVNVVLETEEWKVLINTRRQGDYQIVRHGDMVDFPDPSSLMDKWVTGNADNCAGYSNPAYDALVTAARSEPDNDKRMELFYKAEEILMNDAVVFPQYYYATPYMISPRVRGMYTSPRNRDNFKGIELVD